MKANVKKYRSDEIVLSIGMIVKNEEKHLENCLSALKRFMDQISCELIIVDTGSTDRTKEIAYRYTDQVYDFEWIDDFAAARNFGLEKAKGKWFMFLDADEYMDEDCSQMVTFFQHPEVYEKYNSGTYIVRSYTNLATKESCDFQATRLARRMEGTRFVGKIHETLVHYYPILFFDTVFHHYGYDNQDPDYWKKLKERNWPLMLKELEDNPENGRMVGTIIDGCLDNREKRKYVERALELNALPENQSIRNANLVRAVSFYQEQNEPERVLELVDDFLAIEGNEKAVSVLHMYRARAVAYAKQYRYEKAAEAYEAHLEAYQQYKAGKLDLRDLRALSIYGCSDYEHQKIIMAYVEILVILKRFDRAAELLEQFDVAELTNEMFRLYLANWRAVLQYNKDYASAAALYETVLACGDDDKTDLMLYVLEQYYCNHLSEREDFAKALAESGVNGLYVALMQLVSDDAAGKEITDRLKDFLAKPTSWKDGYAEAVYLCLKHRVDLTPLIETQPYQVLRPHFPTMAGMHTDYAEQVLAYCQANVMPLTLHSMFWMVSALETAVLSAKNLYGERRGQLFDLFVCTLSDYIYNIYNPELLNPEDISVLPELHQFGFYMTAAFQARNAADALGYVRNLRAALRLCEPMKDLVAYYQTQLADAMRQRS